MRIENGTASDSLSVTFEPHEAMAIANASQNEGDTETLTAIGFTATNHAMVEASLGGGNDYCVTCTKTGSSFGKRQTVHAGNGVFAFAKAAKLCGGGFSITKGACH